MHQCSCREKEAHPIPQLDADQTAQRCSWWKLEDNPHLYRIKTNGTLGRVNLDIKFCLESQVNQDKGRGKCYALARWDDGNDRATKERGCFAQGIAAGERNRASGWFPDQRREASAYDSWCDRRAWKAHQTRWRRGKGARIKSWCNWRRLAGSQGRLASDSWRIGIGSESHRNCSWGEEIIV